MERVLQDPSPEKALEKALSTLEATISLLHAVKFEPIVYEDFYDTFVDVLRRIVYPDRVGRLNPDRLLKEFQTITGNYFCPSSC